MKPDLNLIDSLRQLIDFAVLSGNASYERVLTAMLEDVAKAIEQEKCLFPANLAVAPPASPIVAADAQPYETMLRR